MRLIDKLRKRDWKATRKGLNTLGELREKENGVRVRKNDDEKR